MTVAVFDFPTFQALFPELAGMPSAAASMFFNVACGSLLDNTNCSVVKDPAVRLTLLNYATAHLASLAGYPIAAGASGPTPSGSVGRVASAGEGAVSASMDYGPVRESQAWWVQTQYGATFWQMTRNVRTFRFAPRRPYNFGPAPFLPVRNW